MPNPDVPAETIEAATEAFWTNLDRDGLGLAAGDCWGSAEMTAALAAAAPILVAAGLAQALEALDDDERFGEWYRLNVERLDEVDDDMTHAEVASHYLRGVFGASGEADTRA